MLDLGTVRPGSTIRIPFSSFDKDDGSSITMTNFAAADILIYKDGSTTERASTSGFTATTDFDSKTGKHLAIIDLADNTTADFYAAGSEYLVAIDSVTVDAVTVGGWIARFRIGYPGALLDTTIATLSSQTSFTLTTGPAEDDALNGHRVIIHDAASAVQLGWAIISDYTGSTKTVTLAAATTFTVAAKDNISIMDMAPIQPTVAGRTLDVTATGAAGIDWGNVENLTTTNSLTNTTIATVTTTTTATNVTTVNGLAANVITAASIAASALNGKGDWFLASSAPSNFSALAITAGGIVQADLQTIKTQTVTCSGGVTIPAATLASTTNITAGTITTATNVTTVNGIAAGAITAAAIATDAIDADALAADAIAEINATVDTALADVRLDELLAADSDIDGAAPPTVGSVFHELMTKTAGSFTYDQTTDSLEAIRDKETDIETDTQDIQSRLPAALGANGNIKADVRDYNGTAGTFSGGRPEVNTSHWGGTAVASALVRSNLIQVGGSATPVTNLGIVFETDFAFNYNTDLNAWTVNTRYWDAEAVSSNSGCPFVDVSFFNSQPITATSGVNLDLLDAAISSRMATYTQPTGFLAATFPTTVASTTNITAGTITTVSGNVNGSVGSVTGAVGSVTGNVGGNVVGSVASVTGNVGGNVVGSVASVTGAVGSVTGNVGGNVVGSVASVTGNVGGNVVGSVASVTATVSADVVSISGDATAADNLESYLDGTNFMPVDAHKPVFSISGATLTVKKPDGTTTAYTRTLTTDATADPVTGSS